MAAACAWLSRIVNHYAVTKVGRLCMAGIGQDEQLRLGMGCWDSIGSVRVLLVFPSFPHYQRR